ncbi:MAG: hypothetical protein N3C12_07070 [Candidatus Binatia bacterium]|nr:hypothetical protein [Candidatus Binatia bacterium]
MKVAVGARVGLNDGVSGAVGVADGEAVAVGDAEGDRVAVAVADAVGEAVGDNACSVGVTVGCGRGVLVAVGLDLGIAELEPLPAQPRNAANTSRSGTGGGPKVLRSVVNNMVCHRYQHWQEMKSTAAMPRRRRLAAQRLWAGIFASSVCAAEPCTAS